MANLSSWVSEKLHDVVGFSDRHTTEFLINLAKDSSSSGALVEKISQSLGAEEKMVAFARELWEKLPHKEQPSVHPYRAKEMALIEQQKKFSNYKMLSDDEDDEEEVQQSRRKESKSERKRKHLRKKEESSSSEEEVVRDTKSARRDDDDSESDEWEREEKEVQKDLEERDAFAQRLKEKDKDKQRNIVEQSDRKVNMGLLTTTDMFSSKAVATQVMFACTGDTNF